MTVLLILQVRAVIEDSKMLLGPGQKLTARAVARIMHGLDSPGYPRKSWCRCSGWSTAPQVPFEQLRATALQELMDPSNVDA